MEQITKKHTNSSKKTIKKCDCQNKDSCLTSICRTVSFTRFALFNFKNHPTKSNSD